MAKQKTVYVCSECGYETARWLGKCPECSSWNTLVEQEAVSQAPAMAEKKLKRAPGVGSDPLRVDDIPDEACCAAPPASENWTACWAAAL